MVWVLEPERRSAVVPAFAAALNVTLPLASIVPELTLTVQTDEVPDLY
jgi:hypothetical protein